MKRPLLLVLLIACLGDEFNDFSARLSAQEQGGRARNKRLFIVPPPGPVTVDGDLGDWDLSGQIEIYVTKETAATMSARIAAMYDAKALYLSGDFSDPSPLMNQHDPRVEAEKGWDADAFQFRLVLDPKLDYPINESSLDNPRPNPAICHLLLWYYTARQEPCLHLQYGMTYSPPKAGYPQCVVPRDKFDGAYRLADDGKGYTFEYRIPWTTLEAPAPLKAGDAVAAAIQIQWGAPDGLSSGGGGWAMDLMATGGFSFQSTACWGRAIFTSAGDLPPEAREASGEGQSLNPPQPLRFEYRLPADGDVSIALLDENGQMVRHVVAQVPRSAEWVVEDWDGLDDAGQPLPPGRYSWKGIVHEPIRTKHLLSVHNSGQPPYATPDGAGAWGADHGRPSTVCAAGEHMILAWDGGEAGWSILRTDLQGRKQWGIKPGAVLVASDGRERLFASGGFGFHDGAGVESFSLKDGRPLNFGNGRPKIDEPPGGDRRSNTVTGLAWADGKLFVAYTQRDLICVYGAESGSIEASWTVSSPRALAARSAAEVLVITKGRLLRVQAGRGTPFTAEHLDQPESLALDSAGHVYVANRGALQNVSVFSAEGRYLRSIGKPGGRPAVGRYESEGMYEPGGIAVDREGKLWVAETQDSPKRISVWDTASGKLLDEFFGASQYATFVSMDPKHEDEVYCHMTIWKVDLDRGTWRPWSTMWRATEPNRVAAAYERVRVITAINGRQFAWGRANYSQVLYQRDGDVFKPIVAGINVSKGNAYVQWPPYPLFRDHDRWPNGVYLWQDANDDQTIQENEIVKSPVQRAEHFCTWVDADLNLYCDSGQVFPPTRFEPDGRPIYDLTHPAPLGVRGSGGFGGLVHDPHDGSFYCIKNDGQGDASGPGWGRYSADGTMIWGYRSAASWHATLNRPIPKPGQLWGITMPLGVAGDITGVATYFGTFHLMTRDGLYVTQLFKDGRLGETGPDVINAEAFAGQLVRLEASGRYLLLAGDTDGRVTEVTGLDTIQRFDGTHELSDADVQRAAAARREFASLKARAQRLTIARGRGALDLAEPVSKTVEAGRSFTVRAAYDDQNLYLAYDVKSPSDLVNAVLDPQIIFKGGNAIDLQFAADSSADPNRRTPAPGDVRLLVTRQQDRPVAVLFRPKLAGFSGEPIVLKSPTGQEAFDSIVPTEQVRLEYRRESGGFKAVVTIPRDVIGWTQAEPGRLVRMDVGYLFGNSAGSRCAQRAYWSNNSPTANIIDDIPNESRLEPAQWGNALLE